MEYRMRCASTGAPILWLLRGCQNTWECLTSKHQTCSLDDLVASFSAVRISATVLHPAPGPQNLNFGCQEHPQTPSFEVPSSLTQLLHVTSVGKHHFLCFFAQKPSNTHKITLSKPILSPNNAIFQWVSHFKVSRVPGQPLTPESAHPHTHPRRSFTP